MQNTNTETAYQINNKDFYMRHAARYAALSPEDKQKSRDHWTRAHAENVLSDRFDLIIFTGQMLAAMDLFDAMTQTA